MKLLKLIFTTTISLILSSCHTMGTQQTESQQYGGKGQPGDCQHTRFYTFSWSISEHCLSPRGGTTQGTPTKLDPEPHPGWQAIHEPGLSQFEQDRRAILAMAGPYRTSFDFIEIMGFDADYSPDAPYQSWGTEYVYVVEDRQDFISLQHIMVMFMQSEGEVIGPMVMKHWRQDWQYEKSAILQYRGDRTWKLEAVPEAQRRGRWAQAVYQVDDSPRYEAMGQWQHNQDFSSWHSELTWRPLPRREFSVRTDYDVLEGFNKHTIIASGWVHEQENYKRVLNNQDESPRYLAKELGVNRYERIIEHDFSAGDRYWEATQAYWALVRAVFEDIVQNSGSIALKKSVNDQALFVPLFDYAQKLSDGMAYNETEADAYIKQVIYQYLK